MGDIIKLNRTNEFRQIYEIICSQKCVSPLSLIQTHLTENRLRFCCDRIDHDNWSPILNAIAADRSLVEIHAYSKSRRRKIAENIDTEEKLDEYRRSEKASGPIIYTNFMLRCLLDAVAVCSRDSKFLTSLSLDGIPLSSEKYLGILCTGLSFNRNIQSVSLARCKIGDSGCELVLRAFLDNPDLQSINLTSCLLTSKSAQFITFFLKKRRVKLLESAWNESLDNGNRNSKQFQGLHTLILDKNRKFGDKGLRTTINTLKDDFWLKTLGIRRCGLTRKSGNAIIELLETNSILDTINFKENKLPIEILKATRRLLKRRVEKGERISLGRRLINRKKDFRAKRKNLAFGKTTKSRESTSRRDNIVNNRKNERPGLMNDRASELRELKERLARLIDSNRKLKRVLSNDRRLLVGEKRLRIDAEKSYQLMLPVVEKLRYGCQEQNRVRSRVLYESHLCKDIRKIFQDLEDISAINSKNFDVGNSSRMIANEDLIVDKFSFNQFRDKRRTYTGVQKRRHCPPRSRI